MTQPHPTPGLPRALHLVDPLPGLPGHGEFSLTPLDDIGVLFALRSLPDDEQSIRLFVVTPGAFFPDYAPDVRPDVRASIGAGDGSVSTLVVVSPSEDGSRPTANLLAPLVLDPVTGWAVQTVLDGDLPLRAPLG
ncbi:MAG: flagellar assembly protein FliW [Cellulomonas sp.]|nr:flagellar assembly protein FliW [Cellulomonas sp.]